ncbi:hypothetical protein [Nocardia abscessus]|uniref:hypothetical protein n=1 Tax=Nocardia abscessus TaxID=120957 RepID=UPI0024583310|nr:hypothetical protein [Nocardia abscessus]
MAESGAQTGSSSRRSLILGSAAAVAGAGIGVAAVEISEADEHESIVEGAFKIVDRRGQQRFLFDTKKPPIILGGRTYPPETRQGPDASYLIFNDENGNEKGGIIAAGDGALVAMDGTPSIAILDEQGAVLKQL